MLRQNEFAKLTAGSVTQFAFTVRRELVVERTTKKQNPAADDGWCRFVELARKFRSRENVVVFRSAEITRRRPIDVTVI